MVCRKHDGRYREGRTVSESDEVDVPRRLRDRLTYSNVMVTLLAVAVLGGGAIAIGGPLDKQGRIKACFAKKGKAKGDLRLLVKGSKCRKAERKIVWSQKGIQGPEGQPGSPGQPGPQGPPGPVSGSAGGDLTGNYPDPVIAADAVTGAKVAPDSLTGEDIDESTLFNDKSLNAEDIDQGSLTAINASTVRGAGICRGVARVLGGSPANSSVICRAGDPQDQFGVLTLRLECESSGGTTTARLKLETTEDDSFFDDSEGVADQVWNVSEGPKTVLTASDVDGGGGVNGASSEMTSFVAAAPAVGGSVVNFAPTLSAQMAGTAMVHAVENFATGNNTDFCHAALGLTIFPQV
jgi:hypothetical protein